MISNSINSKTTLGFIGLGSIGLPIAANLVKAGFSVKVHTRSREAEKSKDLLGAKRCETPKHASQGSQVLLICVSDHYAVEEVLFGPVGAQNSLTKGSIVIDLSTIIPSKSKEFANKLSLNGVDYIDAPVSGGTEGAKTGTLTIFLGGDSITQKRIEPILNSIASSIYPFGEIGKGQEVKAINQILVAGSFASVAEAIALGEKLQLPMDVVVEALQKGAGNSWALINRAKSMLEDNYPLGFKLHLHHKDLTIAVTTAKNLGLKLPITSKVKELEEKLIKEGYQDQDVSVLKRYIKE